MEDELRERVRRERKRLGLTQKQLAERAGMSERAYQDFEAGRRQPQSPNLRAILREVGVTLDGEIIATGEQVAWPREIAVFLDMLGAYLLTMGEDRRLNVIHDLTRQVFVTERQRELPESPAG